MMNTLRIFMKEIRHVTRDWQAALLMIVFPVVLMSVLGAALSRAFAQDFDVDADVLYTVRGGPAIGAAFDGFRAQAEEMGVRLTQTDDGEQGMRATREATYSCYVVVEDHLVVLYTNDRFATDAGFVQALLAAFVDRYNALRAIAETDLGALERVSLEKPVGYAESVSLSGGREPRSIDYYALTMVTSVIMYASMFGMSSIRRERRLKTGPRILSAPTRPLELLAGKVAGSLVGTAAQVIVVILFSRFVLGAYWGEDLLTVALLLFAHAVMAVSIGAGCAYLIRNEGAAIGLINTLIPLLTWFGGGYVPMELLGPVMERIADFDPVGQTNQALLGVVYGGDYTRVLPALVMSLAIAVVFLAPAALWARREET